MSGRQVDANLRRRSRLAALVTAVAAAVLALTVWQVGLLGRFAAAVAADDKEAGSNTKGSDTKGKDAKGKDAKAADKADSADDDAAKRYQVPVTKDPQELLQFIETLGRYRPVSAEDAQAHQTKAMRAARAAAEQILKLETDKTSDLYQTARQILTVTRIRMLEDSKPAEQKALIDEIVKAAAAPNASREDLSMAMMLTGQLDQLADTKLAADAYSAIGKAFKASDNEQVASLGAGWKAPRGASTWSASR